MAGIAVYLASRASANVAGQIIASMADSQLAPGDAIRVTHWSSTDGVEAQMKQTVKERQQALENRLRVGHY